MEDARHLLQLTPAFAPPMDQPMTSPCQPTSRHFTSQNLRLHYLDWGNPGAPVLILQHGGFDHAHSMDWIARELAADWHVIAPDLRGHGDSAWSIDAAYNMAAYILDFVNLIEALGQDRVTICAHSLGAMITTRFAGLYPEKVEKFINIEGLSVPPVAARLLTITPFAARMREWVAEHRAAPSRRPRHYASEEQARLRMREKNSHLNEEQVAHLTHHALRRNEDGTYGWKFDPRLNIFPMVDFQQEEIESLWQAVACPVLFIHGNESFMPNPALDGRIGHFRNARLIAYDDASHWPHHDRFDAFLPDLKAFLAQD